MTKDSKTGQMPRSHSQIEAERRAKILTPLASATRCSRIAAQDAALVLGLSERQVFNLVRRLRAANGDIAVLVVRKSSGGRGRPRIEQATQNALQTIIETVLQSMPGMPISGLVAEVQQLCRQQQFRPPSVSTLRRRLSVHLSNDTQPTNMSQHNPVDGTLEFDCPAVWRRPESDTDTNLLSVLYDGAGKSDGWDCC